MIRPDLGSLTKTTRYFGEEIEEAFNFPFKILPQKYLYGEVGDLLFQEIMKQPDYYVSKCEYEIFKSKSKEILKTMIHKGLPFNLIDIGAGDGSKTKILIQYLVDNGIDFTYVPIDFSPQVLSSLSKNLLLDFPNLKIKTIARSYSDAFTEVEWDQKIPSLMIFLGTSIGNLTNEEQKRLLGMIARTLKKGDEFMLGVDLQKDPEVIVKAYKGFSDWNLNYLETMNQKLGANFIRENFTHYPVYDPLTGCIYLYLMSKVDQEVYLKDLDKIVSFESGEPMLVLMSKKYRLTQLKTMAKENGFKVVSHFQDSRNYFVDSLWEKTIEM